MLSKKHQLAGLAARCHGRIVHMSNRTFGQAKNHHFEHQQILESYNLDMGMLAEPMSKFKVEKKVLKAEAKYVPVAKDMPSLLWPFFR